ncbi:PocR ligand-binding domain-containing protein [Alkalibacter mobilis]|uniref:PocR ligand-binding domain-containing protein n=1 Tax=Alkalibacter mobilis TaxID=2787712 RepID=UPI0018A0BB9C|nr:PocR ligand-binding domain-containing protein [Alkalibacter mobilis]MBF7096387.1 PocR ligand-binding domain-containing protein [Alkalibacter mobilis]
MENNRKQLLEIVDKDFLKNILDAFTKATGLTANIVDVEGRSIFSKKDAQKNCQFCKMIWEKQREKGVNRCRGAYSRAGKQAAIFGEPYIFRCPAGLIEWAAPIVIDNKHLGSIICGQVLMWEPEEFFWIELREMNKNIIDDFGALFDAAKELKVVSGEKVQGAADLLHMTANYIMDSGWKNLKHQEEMDKQKTLLNQEIGNRKYLEEQLSAQCSNHLLDKERELTGKIKIGDLNIMDLFRSLLREIFINSGAKIGVYKARVLELGVILSRAFIEGGADMDATLEISTEFLQKVNGLETMKEINLGAENMLEGFISEIKSNTYSKNKMIIRNIKAFIRSNYDQNLTLEDIASSVYLSPSYVSRVFRENQGITITDYLAMVKLEHAKKMLKNPEFQIDYIAKKLGYSDASYFSKVFKKKEGMSPTQYRTIV